MTLWLVTDFGPVPDGPHVISAAYVHAESVAEAAETGRLALKSENISDDQDYCQTVAVTPAELAWFEFDAKAVPCELQCCGGAYTTDGRHSAFCAQRTSDQEATA